MVVKAPYRALASQIYMPRSSLPILERVRVVVSLRGLWLSDLRHRIWGWGLPVALQVKVTDLFRSTGIYWLTPINFGSSAGDKKNRVSTRIQYQLLNQFTEWEEFTTKDRGISISIK